MSDIWKTFKRVKFKIPCFLFEMQAPSFVWNSLTLGIIAYRLHHFLCPEIWMLRFFPKYLDSLDSLEVTT